jgi:peptidoglycan/xylan/chitin deacetylase (PgdA/CDA1 family)
LTLYALLLTLHGTVSAYTPGKFYYQGHTKEKVIALTFDDGPGSFTPQILSLLKEHHARATFFMEGDQIPSYPQFAQAVADAGMEIGNHTWSHPDFHKVKEAPAARLEEELQKTEDAIQKFSGVSARIVRMPHGYFNKTWLLPTLRQKGYALVHWSFGEDWHLKLTSEKMAADYIQNAFPGAVFLFHDGGRHREKTLAALKIVIPTLEQKGYRFVAAEDLFKDEP